MRHEVSRGLVTRLRKFTHTFWKAAQVKLGSVISGLVILIVGAALGAMTQWAVTRWLGRLPSEAYVKVREEAQIALKPPGQRDCEAYVSLFAARARIIDVANHAVSDNSDGILDRCRNLPKFITLEHIPQDDPTMPTHGYPVLRTETKQTFSDANNVEHSPQGYERWVFVKENGEWKIDEFEFDLPAPSEER